MRVMRAILTSLALILMSVTLMPAPASADFHPLCTGTATGYANVALEAESSGDPYEGDILTYSGTVHCPDAQVTITSLQIRSSDGGILAQVEGEPCLSELGVTCDLEGQITATDGSYEVRMLFDVDDPANTGETEYEDVPRHATYEYLGDGQPVPTCTSIGFFPVYAPPEC